MTKRSGRPPLAEAAATRECIVRAALEVFGELGYDAATFEEISSRAGITRPAVSHHFGDKRSLYGELVERATATAVASAMAQAEGQTSLVKRLSAFFSAVMHTESHDRSEAAFLLTSVLESQRHPELSCAQHNAFQVFGALVSWAVTEAIDNGEITSTAAVPALVEILVAIMWGMGFYAGYVGGHDQLGALVDKLELLLANELWEIAS